MSDSESPRDAPGERTYQETLQHLFTRAGAGIKLGLRPTRALLEALGHPERQGPRFVVVAGTNGKGSTSALIASALERAGHCVGLYTSPHLLRFTERIRVNGEEISPAAVTDTYAAVRAAEPHCPRPPTYFECVTAMALLRFAQARVDVAILEVGLGGRLDATNAVPKTLSVITPVDLDHTHLLGNTVEEIAREKSGIIDAGGTVVVAEQGRAAAAVIAQDAQEQKSVVVTPPRWREKADGRWQLDDTLWSTDLAAGLRPAYQMQNLATAWSACATLDAGGIACPPDARIEAARSTTWPGRYQWIAPDVLVDAAHNAAGLKALGHALAADPSITINGRRRPVHGIFSCTRTKPAADLLALLRREVDTLLLCPVCLPRSLTVEELAHYAAPEEVCPDVGTALGRARRRAARDGGLVLVTGSIFLLSDAITWVTGEPRDPPVAL